MERERVFLTKFSKFFNEKDPELYKKLSPLGSRIDDDGNVGVFSLSEVGTHYTEEEYEKFLEYLAEFKNENRFL